MTHLQALVNVRWALALLSSVGDLPPAVSTTGAALYLLLSAPQFLPQGAAIRLASINMQLQRFMAHWQLAGDLLWAPLQPQQCTGLLFHPGCMGVGVADLLGAFARKVLRIVWLYSHDTRQCYAARDLSWTCRDQAVGQYA
jgi:hypothetical protein